MLSTWVIRITDVHLPPDIINDSGVMSTSVVPLRTLKLQCHTAVVLMLPNLHI
jgi:hypothetical protein